MALISLAEAKADLRVLDDESDDDIQLKADLASAIILDYLKVAPEKWDADSVPFPVKAAIILALRNLFDDDDADPLTVQIMAIVERFRDPALA